VVQSLSNWGNMLRASGKPAEAEAPLREALAMGKRLRRSEDPDTALIVNSLAGALQAQGKLSEAESAFREVLAMQRRLLGDKHPQTTRTLNSLAELLRLEGKADEAKALLESQPATSAK